VSVHFLHIGGFRGNEADDSRIVMSCVDMYTHRKIKPGWGQHVYMDLNEGKDFLVDPIPFVVDVLILHWVYDGPYPVKGPSLFRVSPHNTIENWRKAIQATRAPLVYVYGDEDEISADKLGDLPRYKRDLVKVGARTRAKQVYVLAPLLEQATRPVECHQP
jgi:hypothetical protein